LEVGEYQFGLYLSETGKKAEGAQQGDRKINRGRKKEKKEERASSCIGWLSLSHQRETKRKEERRKKCLDRPLIMHSSVGPWMDLRPSWAHEFEFFSSLAPACLSFCFI